MTCQEAAEWASREFDVGLSTGPRIALGLHRLLCAKCRLVHGQLAMLEDALSDYVQQGLAAAVLTEQARERIKTELANELSE
jgi:hypothetical protein